MSSHFSIVIAVSAVDSEELYSGGYKTIGGGKNSQRPVPVAHGDIIITNANVVLLQFFVNCYIFTV